MEARHLTGKPLVNFVVLEGRQAVRQHLVTLPLRPEVAHAGEFVRVEPRGRHGFDASLRCTAVRDPQTCGVRAVCWLLCDLSEHSRAKGERYRLIVDSLEDCAIFTLDAAGRVTHWNRGAERILGYSEVDAVGTPYADLFPPEDRERGVPEREMLVAQAALGPDLHRLAVDLRPTSLDDLGPVNALSACIDDWSERTGIRVDFQPMRMDGARLPGVLETALYRIAQEALNNVAKYSGARLVTVLLRQESPGPEGSPEQVVLIVEDDGRGFDADAATVSSEDVQAPAAAGTGRPRLGGSA